MKKAVSFLEVAGIRVSFEFVESGFKALVARRYKNFNSSGRPLYTFSVSAVAGRRTPFKPVLSEKGGFLRLKRGDFDCVLDLKTGRGSLRAAPRVQAFDSFLRTFYSWLLPRRGGLLIHGAGIVKRGKAYVFPGVSGAGKSTLSKLAASVSCRPAAPPSRRPTAVSVLSDELVPVRREEGRFYAYGSPFWGEMRCKGQNKRYPLDGIYKISKAEMSSITAIGNGAALRLLLRCSMNFSKDAGTAALMLALAAELTAEKAAGELRFSKDSSAFLDLL